MKKQDFFEKKETHTFFHPWSHVIKGFWTKYPSTIMPFVKFNNVIDIEIIDSDTIRLKRIMESKIPRTFFYFYSLEDIVINLKENILEMKSSIIKKSKFFPVGKEFCTYAAVMNDGEKHTLYTKNIESTNKIAELLKYFSKSFAKGCQIVEENTVKLENLNLK